MKVIGFCLLHLTTKILNKTKLNKRKTTKTQIKRIEHNTTKKNQSNKKEKTPFPLPVLRKIWGCFSHFPWSKLDQILGGFIVVQLQSCSWKGASQKGKCSSNYWFSGNMLVFRRVLQLWDLNSFSDSSFEGEVKALMICAKGCSLEKKTFCLLVPWILLTASVDR